MGKILYYGGAPNNGGKRLPSMIRLDQHVAGTSDPRRLRLLVKLYAIHPERNTPAQRQQLAAAERLLKDAGE